MAYIGPAPNPGQNREVDDISSGFNGSEVNFTLQVNSQNVSPGSSNAIIVSLGGVVQNPGTDYTVAASTLTFTTAPASGLSFFGLVLGQQVDTADANFNDPVITGDLSIADKIVHTGDTNNAIRFPAADTITAETGGSERLRVDSSGLVGIGVSTPSSFNSDGRNLVVGTGSGGQGISIYSANNNYGNIYFADGTSDGSYNAGGILYNHSSNFMRFDTAAGERMRIDSSGKVGIGTTSPSQQLTLVSSGDSKINIRGHGSSTGYFLGMPDATNAQVWNAENGYIQIASNDTERIRVNASGSVLFHQTTSEVPGLANTVVGACFEKVGTNGSALFVSRADSICTFLNRNNTGEIITFRQSGSQVGSISTNGSSLPSDRNFKKNITDLTLGLDFVNTLKPSKFNLKLEEDTAPLLFGLIAQDVEESLTAAGVTKNSTVLCQHKPTESETESDYNLDYGKLTPILINAVKELSAKITTLETKVAALEAA